MRRWAWGALLTGGFALLVAALVSGCGLRLPSPAWRASPTLTATHTASPTPSRTPLPTSTPTPTPTPTPTSAPEQRFAAAAEALRNGDYAAARAGFEALLQSPFEPARVRLELGSTYLRAGEPERAAEVLATLVADAPSAARAPQAHILLADALLAAGDAPAAADQYRAYLSSSTVITAYVSEWLGDALVADGNLTNAALAYEAALAASPDRSFEEGVREKLALVYVGRGDAGAALEQYDAILAVARIPAYRARIEHQAAETALLAGRIDEGYAHHLAVVENYPSEPYAYLSLVTLVEAGYPVSDYLRGVVDYYGGAYEAAIAALNRYVLTYPETHTGDAHLYTALSYQALGQPAQAEREYHLLLETHPESERHADAWMGLAELRAATGQIQAAVEAYRALVLALPTSPRAAEALWRAGYLLERNGDWEGAAQAYLDCHTRYPDSEYAPGALFRAGLQAYRLGDLTTAASAWDRLAGLGSATRYRAAALVWLGKVRLAQGDDKGAIETFRQAANGGEIGYYPLRAAELVADLRALPFGAMPFDLGPTAAAEQRLAEHWLRGWLGSPADAALGELPRDLAADPRLMRGLELWAVGHFEEAQREFEALRAARRDDARAQYALALRFREIGLYRASILCAQRVIELSPEGNVLAVPRFIARLAYPTYYASLVLADAAKESLDPLLVFALIRQESLFEGLATSGASAHGLMQVIPSTGAQIAAELGWPPDYATPDLYRPLVSVRFGTYYLAQQRDRFDGRLEVALAAYNGGPGNAQRWLAEAGDDPDMFLEMITYGETRLYLERIKEHLAVYQALYGLASGGAEADL